MKKFKKVFVIGGGGDGDWIEDSVRVTKLEQADVVIFPGGTDINPSIYGEKCNKHTYINTWSMERDAKEIEAYSKCLALGIYTCGICRGLQLQTALNGGKLIQDISHTGQHWVSAYDGKRFIVNSLHHQMCNPYMLPDDHYNLIAWASELSSHYTGEDNKELQFPSHAFNSGGFMEPEILFFPKTRSLGCQFHPEAYACPSEAIEYMNKCLYDSFINPNVFSEYKRKEVDVTNIQGGWNMD